MKKIQKIALSMIAALILLAVIQSPAKASTNSTGTIYQTSCTTNSATVTWTNPNLYSNNYTVTGYTLYDSSNNVIATLPASTNSYTIYCTGSYSGSVTLYYNYNYTGSYSYSRSSYYGYAYISTQPTVVDRSNFAVNSILSYSKKVSVAVVKPDSVTGAQIEVYKGNKLVYTEIFYSSSSYFSIAKDAVYKYRVRYYYKNYDSAFSTPQYYYGDWSAFRYFDFASLSGKAKSNKKGISVNLKKATGVSKYTVYVKTSSNGSYKKVKTISVGSKKKYTYQITKKYKKKATNYIRIVPYIKGYGNSDIFTTGNVYVYK